MGGCGGATQPLAFNYTETTGLTLEARVGLTTPVASTRMRAALTWIMLCSSLATVRILATCTGLCATAGAVDGAKAATFDCSASVMAPPREPVNPVEWTQRRKTGWPVLETRRPSRTAASALFSRLPATPLAWERRRWSSEERANQRCPSVATNREG